MNYPKAGDVQDDVLLNLRKTYPGMGRGMDHGNSRSSAIKVFCKSCMGGNAAAVKECPSRSCPLWQFRGPGESTNPVVPTTEQYDEWSAARNTGDGGEGLRKWREGLGDDENQDES